MANAENRQLTPTEIRNQYQDAKLSGIVGGLLGIGGIVAENTPNAPDELKKTAAMLVFFGVIFLFNSYYQHRSARREELRQIEDAENAF